MNLLLKYFLILSVIFLTNERLFSQTHCNPKREHFFIYDGKRINYSDSNGKRDGYWMYFSNCNPMGNIYAEGFYKNGIKNGEWIYRKWYSDYGNEFKVTYTEDGAIIFDIYNGGVLRINRDSTLAPNYSTLGKNIYRTWCHRLFGTDYYECIKFNNRKQTPLTYDKKLIHGFINAINEIMGYTFSENKLMCIMERDLDYYLVLWHRE